eukprot:2206262-Amphidinium_carterae.1
MKCPEKKENPSGHIRLAPNIHNSWDFLSSSIQFNKMSQVKLANLPNQVPSAKSACHAVEKS